MRGVAADTVRAMYGKQESAAEEAHLSPSRFSHKLSDGTITLAELERFGGTYAAEFGAALVKTFGSPDPMVQARDALKMARACVDRALEMLVEAV